MMEDAMSDHLSIERISALLDEPGRDGAGRAHLETCDACRAELERLGRMRMALSGLGSLEPPADEWERIAAALDGAAGLEGDAAGGGAAPEDGPGPWSGALRGGWGWPTWSLQLAAGVLLFAGGILAGYRFTASAGEDDPALAGGDGGVASGQVGSPAAPFGELDGPLPVAELGDESGMDPVAAAERLARLDALIAASREAVSESPADPVANDLLFELVERRQDLAGRLQQTLHLATMEIR